MILFINACVRKDSRTKRLADQLLAKLGEPYTELKLEDVDFPVVDEAFLNKRDGIMQAESWEDPLCDLARQFAEADKIVIAAPYWDLSFPASLKQYFEQINVMGITFKYSDEGFPISLCKADKLYYVTTAGGQFVPEEFGFGYVKTLAESFYGISDVEKIMAVGLDVVGADVEGILSEVLKEGIRI